MWGPKKQFSNNFQTIFLLPRYSKIQNAEYQLKFYFKLELDGHFSLHLKVGWYTYQLGPTSILNYLVAKKYIRQCSSRVEQAVGQRRGSCGVSFVMKMVLA